MSQGNSFMSMLGDVVNFMLSIIICLISSHDGAVALGNSCIIISVMSSHNLKYVCEIVIESIIDYLGVCRKSG